MKLTVLERVMLGQILPAETNFVQYKIINGLRLLISFSEEENKKFGIVQDFDKTGQGQVTWKVN